MAEERRTATALRNEAAPRVVAKAHGSVGDEVLRLAKKHDAPLRQDPALAGALAQLDLGVSVPPEMFRAVAEVLAFVHKMNESVGKK